MASFIIIVGLIALAIFLLVVLYKHFTTKSRIKKAFIEGNVMVSGRKGFGKDVLFSTMINSRKEPYFANINYGGNYTHITFKELLLGDNTYNNFIYGNVKPCEKNTHLETHDIYISDGGIYLPSQADSVLHKAYPSLPITYALSRHLFNNGLHVNTQRLDRVWKALREQADYFVLMRKRCLKLPFLIVLFTTEYTKYDSALQELAPMKNTLFNKYSKAEQNLYKAKHGFIKDGLIIVTKRSLHYDTRAFHKVIYGEEAPRKETLCQKVKKKCCQFSKKTCNSSKKKSTTIDTTKGNY